MLRARQMFLCGAFDVMSSHAAETLHRGSLIFTPHDKASFIAVTGTDSGRAVRTVGAPGNATYLGRVRIRL